MLKVAGDALEYAASLGEVAQQLGVTTRDLQVFRYAATQVGISQDEMDKGLGKLTQTMGKAAAGAKAPAAAFGAIGISLAELRGKTAGDVLPMIADGLKKIESPAQRAAVEVALFGKVGQKLDTLLKDGSSGINELTQAAESLGIVLSDRQIQDANATASKLSQLQTVLSANIAGAVADNARSIYGFVDSLTKLVAKIPEAIRAMQNFRDRIGVAEGLGRTALGVVTGNEATMNDGLYNARQAGARIKNRNAQAKLNAAAAKLERKGFIVPRNADGTVYAMGVRRAPKRPTGGGDGAQFLAGGGGGRKKGGGGAGDAERQRKDALRDAFRADSDERRARMEILRAQQDLAHDVKDRGVIAEQLLALEKQDEQAQIAQNVAMGDLTKAQADKQLALLDTVSGLQLERQKQDEAYEIQRAMIERQRAIADSAIEVQEMEASLAETAAERRTLELRIVQAKFAQLRQIQQDVIDDQRSSQEQKDAAGRRLIDLDKLQGGATEQTLRGTRGPFEEFLNTLPNTAAQANEALEAVATGGIASLVDGLTDAMSGARSLGDVFSSVTKGIIADLIKIQIQKAIVGALGKAMSLFGGGGGSEAGLFGKQYGGGGGLAGGLDLSKVQFGGLPKLAGGGVIKVGGRGGVDTNLLSINGRPAAMVNRGENIRVDPTNDNARGSIVRVIVEENPMFAARVQTIAGGQVEAYASSQARVRRYTK
jgi:hypothetical protein